MQPTVYAVIDGKEVPLGTVKDGIIRPPLDEHLEPLAGILHEKLEMTFTGRGAVIGLPGGVSWRTFCLRNADAAVLLRVRSALPRSRRSPLVSRLRKWVGKEIARRWRLEQRRSGPTTDIRGESLTAESITRICEEAKANAIAGYAKHIPLALNPWAAK